MKKLDLEELSTGYDVVVVGAGPAGCMAAKELSSSLSTLIIDAKALPRDKPCGGLLVSESMTLIEELAPKESSFYVRPKALDITYVDWENGTESKAEKGFSNIDRKKFDSWLLSLLETKKVTLCDKTKLLDYYFTKDKKFAVLVLESNGTIRSIVARHVIGCGGALSKTREKIFPKATRYYLAIQETVRGKQVDSAYFIYDNSITDFYSWIIPKGNTTVIGAALPPYKAKDHFKDFKKKLSKELGITYRGSVETAALILRPESIEEVFFGKHNCILAGEAAGLISPSSGEGISFAMQSGKFAAEAITENPDNPLAVYTVKCKVLLDRLKPKFAKSAQISNPSSRKKISDM